MKNPARIALPYIFLSAALLLLISPRPSASQKPPSAADAQTPPLLSANIVAALDQELSGETAKRNLEGITRFHRMRASRGFHDAAELVAERARAYGVSDVTILSFPADGKTFYGTQKSRLAWDADFAELWEMHEDAGKRTPAVRLASWDAMPISLAEDSESADVTANLIDVGQGTLEADYQGKDVRGKIVLVAAQPGAVQDLAVGKYGAAGIVSYALNQPQAWRGEDENLIRWGHLESFSEHKTFAFMVSLKTARALRDRLGHSEQIRLHAIVKAGQHPGELNVVTATIPGADPKLRDEEIAFSCHLDHQRPGANDNASGCVTILEVARTLQKLISEGKLARPARTLRFIWPPEVEGTVTLLNAKPEFARRIKAVIHMDMVGGGPATKAIFHVTRGPMSLPSFVYDVAEAFGDFVNRESDHYAGTGNALYPFVSPEGGKEALQADFADYSMGSDHDVYQDSSFRIPAIYLNDWPDRYIHTNGDVAANIDPTKLKRAAFIGAASGYFLATMTTENTHEILKLISRSKLRRAAKALGERILGRDTYYSELIDCVSIPDKAVTDSIEKFMTVDASTKEDLEFSRKNCAEAPSSGWTSPRLEGELGAEIVTSPKPVIYVRNNDPRGPMSVFGYDYLTDHLSAKHLDRPELLDFHGLWGSGEEYAYETLNFVDGKRNTDEICALVSDEYGPVSIYLVFDYLKALESVGVLKRVQ
jgi:aminopeptidase YwaD